MDRCSMSAVTTTRPNGDAARRHSRHTQSEDQCPLCGNPISASMRGRLEDRLRTQVDKAEQDVRNEFARERAQADTRMKAEIEKIRREAAKAAEQQIRSLRSSQEAV